MKKIGICACYATHNYGSMLQTYATQVAVGKLGYDSEYIVYKKKKDILYLIKQFPRLFNKNLMFDKMMIVKKKIYLIQYPSVQKLNGVRNNCFKHFQNNYFKNFSQTYYGFDALRKGAHNYNTVLVGSDQLWTPGGLATNFYNLMFVPDNINKVSYAASFGVDKIPKYQIKRTRQYLCRINYLSVREIQGAKIVKEVSGCEAKVVVDPTLLLTGEEWLQLIPPKTLVPSPYILCYFLGDNINHREIAEKLKKNTGIKIVCTPYLDSFVKRDLYFGDRQLFDIGPDDFVNLVRGAKYILTDSFHGTVFSILYHKQFITFNRFLKGEQSRNSRIDSLFSLLGLEERRFKNDIFTEISSLIDYCAVDARLSLLRAESLDFLKAALENN